MNAILGGGTKYCQASNTNFSDFAYEVQVTIVKGDRGGIVFRNDHTKGNNDYFFIGQDGTYALWIFRCTSNNCISSGLRMVQVLPSTLAELDESGGSCS